MKTAKTAKKTLRQETELTTPTVTLSAVPQKSQQDFSTTRGEPGEAAYNVTIDNAHKNQAPTKHSKHEAKNTRKNRKPRKKFLTQMQDRKAAWTSVNQLDTSNGGIRTFFSKENNSQTATCTGQPLNLEPQPQFECGSLFVLVQIISCHEIQNIRDHVFWVHISFFDWNWTEQEKNCQLSAVSFNIHFPSYEEHRGQNQSVFTIILLSNLPPNDSEFEQTCKCTTIQSFLRTPWFLCELNKFVPASWIQPLLVKIAKKLLKALRDWSNQQNESLLSMFLCWCFWSMFSVLVSLQCWFCLTTSELLKLRVGCLVALCSISSQWSKRSVRCHCDVCNDNIGCCCRFS